MMRSETNPTLPSQVKVKEMFKRVMTVAELLAKSVENRESKHQPGDAMLQKTQK